MADPVAGERTWHLIEAGDDVRAARYPKTVHGPAGVEPSFNGLVVSLSRLEGRQAMCAQLMAERDEARDQHIERVRERECICMKTGDEWWTPPSCPFHGVKHLRDRHDHRIRRGGQTVFDELDQALAERDRLAEALKELLGSYRSLAANAKGYGYEADTENWDGPILAREALASLEEGRAFQPDRSGGRVSEVLMEGERTWTACACCGAWISPRDPDPWEGRLDAYCEECATTRCDAYPGDCSRPRLVELSRLRAAEEWIREAERDLDELEAERDRLRSALSVARSPRDLEAAAEAGIRALQDRGWNVNESGLPEDPPDEGTREALRAVLEAALPHLEPEGK